MRLCGFFLLLLALAAFSVAQDTNSPGGLQYLNISGSPLFVPLIVTPTSEHGSDLGPPPPPVVETHFNSGPQYLIPSGSPEFLHPISPPSLSFPSGLTQSPTLVTTVSEPKADEAISDMVSAVLDEQARTVLYSMYYGYPQPNVVEIAFRTAAEREAAPPSSIAESGIVELTSAQALRDRGYGVTLAEAAARWKAHTVRARRVYTNDDIERLRPRD
jgi:hypothetical protein